MKIRADIAELLHAGHRDNAIARQLGACPKTVARARAALGLPKDPPGRTSHTSIEDAWRAHTQPTDDGHLLWTGTINNGVPAFYHKGHRHSAYLIAYRIGRGRDPQGRCWPDCDRAGCVKPSHVDDGPGRARTRATLAAIFGAEAPR